MTSLFSSFDIKFQSFCLLVGFLTLFLTFKKFFVLSKLSSLKILVFKFFIKFFETLKPKNFSKSVFKIILSVAMFLIVENSLGVLPFNFASTSQVHLTLGMALILWVSGVVMIFMKLPQGFISHMIPEGAPMGLAFLLFAIELISTMIRPITLMVRLTANIVTGHLLMILMAKVVVGSVFGISVYVILNALEMFVALIQSYIFATMVTLYYSDLS